MRKVAVVLVAAGLVPTTHPARDDVFMPLALDYKLVLNVLGLAAFAVLVGLTLRTSATDPVCGMAVDRRTAFRLDAGGRTYYFCGPGCRER